MASSATHIRNPEFGETLKHGQKDVAVDGTAEALADAGIPCYEVLLQAKQGNTGRIYIGGVDVPNDDTGGVYLTAGQSLPLTPQFLSDIYINATVAGEGVTFIYW